MGTLVSKPLMTVSRTLYSNNIQLLLQKEPVAVISVHVSHTESKADRIRKEASLLSLLGEGFDVKVCGVADNRRGE